MSIWVVEELKPDGEWKPFWLGIFEKTAYRRLEILEGNLAGRKYRVRPYRRIEAE